MGVSVGGFSEQDFSRTYNVTDHDIISLQTAMMVKENKIAKKNKIAEHGPCLLAMYISIQHQ